MATNQFLNVPLSMPDTAQHIRLISSVINNTVDGKLNATGDVTLTASATTTTLTDARIGANSIILFMPTKNFPYSHAPDHNNSFNHNFFRHF